MRYILAFFLPPFALLACRKYVQFTINLIFWLLSFPLMFAFGIGVFVWLICTAHALIVCRMNYIDRQVGRLVSAIQSREAAAASASTAPASNA